MPHESPDDKPDLAHPSYHIDIRAMEPGTVVATTDGATVVITRNPNDGVWLLGVEVDPEALPEPGTELDDRELMIFCDDVCAVVRPPAPLQ